MTELTYYRGRYEELQRASMGHSLSCCGQKMILNFWELESRVISLSQGPEFHRFDCLTRDLQGHGILDFPVFARTEDVYHHHPTVVRKPYVSDWKMDYLDKDDPWRTILLWVEILQLWRPLSQRQNYRRKKQDLPEDQAMSLFGIYPKDAPSCHREWNTTQLLRTRTSWVLQARRWNWKISSEWGLKSRTAVVELRKGWKKLKRLATPKEDQKSQLSQTPEISQTLSPQPAAYKNWWEDPDAYTAEDCLVWPQWENPCLTL